MQIWNQSKWHKEVGRVKKRYKKKKALKAVRMPKKPVSITFLMDGKELFTAVRETLVERF